MKLKTYLRKTGIWPASAFRSAPCGTFRSSTMMVMMIAITPSLNAVNRSLRMAIRPGCCRYVIGAVREFYVAAFANLHAVEPPMRPRSYQACLCQRGLPDHRSIDLGHQQPGGQLSGDGRSAAGGGSRPRGLQVAAAAASVLARLRFLRRRTSRRKDWAFVIGRREWQTRTSKPRPRRSARPASIISC